MTREEALAGVAQLVINVNEGINFLEKGSKIFNALEALCEIEGSANMTAEDAITMVDTLMKFAGSNKLPCLDQLAKKGGMPCLRSVNPSWGRPLTKSEYAKMCATCLAYWHLASAKNDLIAFNRSK